MIRTLAITISMLALAMQMPVLAQETSSCSSPGTMSFSDIPTSRRDIVPSVHRQLSGIGRAAKVNGCAIQVTCVGSSDADQDATRARNRQCLAVTQALVIYESRPDVRSALARDVTQTKTTASGALKAGVVYVTLR